MIPLPAWAKPYIQNRTCPYCQCEQKPEWVCGIGIREIERLGESSLAKGNIGLSYEYMCPSCNRQSTTVINPGDPNVSAFDLVKEILKLVSEDGSNKMTFLPNISQSKISDQEIEDLKNSMQKMSHYDFMLYIGVPEEQIEKYSKPDPNDKKN